MMLVVVVVDNKKYYEDPCGNIVDKRIDDDD